LAVVSVVLTQSWWAAVAAAGPYDTVLVSRASGAGGAKGNGPSGDPSISANGRFVAFTSEASNLTRDDSDAIPDVFVRDLWTNTTTLVSRATGASGAKGNGATGAPSISGDGRLVAFEAVGATNLSPADGDTRQQVFVRDLQTNITTLVSRYDGPEGAPLSYGAEPAISSNGNVVVFRSLSLSPDSTSRDGSNIVARDLQTNRTIDLGGGGYFTDAFLPSVTADGSSVAFLFAGLFTEGRLGISGDPGVDLSPGFYSGAYGIVAPSISGDGGRVAFQDAQPVLDANGEVQGYREIVSLRDVRAATTSLVSRASGPNGEEPDGDSGQPSLAGGGRFVAFASVASNLTSTPGGAGNVFVRDLLSSTTTLVSRASGRAGKPGAGSEPSISVDGAAVAFTSSGTNLSPDDSDAVSDVFVRGTANRPPDCRAVGLNPARLWPPDHSFTRVTATGATDPDAGDSARLVIDAITQDEPVNPGGGGVSDTDARLPSPRSNIAWVRAERDGHRDGRVYRVHFTATDTSGATCAARRTVGVPHDLGAGASPIDSAPPNYNSLIP
jgi:Tol biopolymer transport system component